MTDSHRHRISALLLLGPTGVGKSPLGDLLAAQGLHGRRCLHFDFGASLRQVEAQPASADLDSSERAVVLHSLQTGALLEDEDFPIAAKLLAGFANRHRAGPDDLLVLNGLPRHVGQARHMVGLVDVLQVVVLEAEASTIHQRILQDSGGDRGQRTDDQTELIEYKLKTFRQRTRPLIVHYADCGAQVHRLEVDVNTSSAELLAQL